MIASGWAAATAAPTALASSARNRPALPGEREVPDNLVPALAELGNQVGTDHPARCYN
jgi:hypothetical protein